MATVGQWIQHLRAVAGAVAADAGPLGLGDLEVPFRAAANRRTDAGSPPPKAPDDPSGDVALWWSIVDNSVEVDPVIALPTEGGLFPQGRFRTIEVWTEAELCGLHALARLARERGRSDWSARVAAVRDWHLEHTQPDNATNRPWALHVFLLGGTPEATHYAETLLHNCLAGHGDPEPLSACILMDCANELETHALPT